MDSRPPPLNDRVNAVSRALSLLDYFRPGAFSLGLGEICSRSGLPKTTVLRLLCTLEEAGYVRRTLERGWRLGPGAARLAVSYEQSVDTLGVIRATLTSLAATTHMAATFFVKEGDVRVLLIKVQHGQDDVPLQVGQTRPLERGAAGKVILAYEGLSGSVFDSIRRRGFEITFGEVNRKMASLAAPVSASRRVLGSICLSAPLGTHQVEELQASAPAVVAAGSWISSAMSSARFPARDTGAASSWCP